MFLLDVNVLVNAYREDTPIIWPIMNGWNPSLMTIPLMVIRS